MTEMVEQRVKISKKPNSTVWGDLPPKLLNLLAHTLSYPLASIFNSVPENMAWPKEWKREYQTIIPKKNRPANFSELRNLSCTNFFSKVLESFVIDSIKSEINLSELQYGGIKGCGTDNFLIEVWNNVLETLDEGGKAVSLMSVDFSKAFNRLDHKACLEKMAEKYASNQTIRLVYAFLNEREMCVRSGSVVSTMRPVKGGSPQGTKLGNLLFCITIDDIAEPANSREQKAVTITPPNSPDNAIPYHHRPSVTSTPKAGTTLDDSFEPNPHGVRRKINVINDTLPFPASHKNQTGDTWEIGYIDDLNIGESLNIEDGINHFTTSKQVCEIRAEGCEEAYEVIEKNGRKVGMKINSAKTQLLCFSSHPNIDVRSFVSIDERKLISAPELKILGFIFGSDPTPRAHVDNLCKKFNNTVWSLVHLRRANMSENVLVRVYKSMVRPVIEYGGNVFYSMLNEKEREKLEKCQKTALKIIYGFEKSYENMLEKANLERLNDRRRKLFESFTIKMARSERFRTKWLPRRNVEEDEIMLRRRKKYVEFRAKGSKLYQSPVFEMRRFLNQYLE